MSTSRKTSLMTDTDGTTYLMFWCPGCDEFHGPIVAREDPARPQWTWNGDRERPTIAPSLLVRGTVPITDDEAHRISRGEPFTPQPRVCHSFIRDGQIQFLGDCTHSLAGQTVPIPDMPDREGGS